MNDVEIRQIEGSTFLAKGPSNHWVVMDAKKEVYGQDAAVRPMELILIALGGCSGIDVDLILRKMRIRCADFRIEISGERRETEPRIYTDIHMVYHFWGDNLPKDKLERAVKLSKEKYCSVSAMLDKTAAITTEVILHAPEAAAG